MPLAIVGCEENQQGNVTRVLMDNGKWYAVPPEIQVPQSDLMKIPFRRDNGELIFSGAVVRKRLPKDSRPADKVATFEGNATDEVVP